MAVGPVCANSHYVPGTVVRGRSSIIITFIALLTVGSA